jgi:hypothetical protein
MADDFIPTLATKYIRKDGKGYFIKVSIEDKYRLKTLLHENTPEDIVMIEAQIQEIIKKEPDTYYH